MENIEKENLVKLEIDLNEVITGYENEPLQGQNVRGVMGYVTVRNAFQWVVHTIPSDLHTRFDVMAIIHDVRPQLKLTNDKLVIEDPETHKTLKDFVTACRNLSPEPKEHLLN